MDTTRYTLAIDIGGTFTDLVVLDSASGELTVVKILTTYPDPSDGVLEGVRSLLNAEGPEGSAIDRVIHGTTLVTNALIERKGARTALLTTEGFRDALEIGREGRYDIYDLFLELPAPLVERRLRMEVPERVNVRGETLTPLDEGALRRVCADLRSEGIEAVAVSFIHSYVNPGHEQRAAEVLGEVLGDAAVSVSHRIAPEMREYERTSTTVANAYVQPLVARYLGGLEQGLRDVGVAAPLQIMLSNGGTCSAETAAEFPVRLVESGPCGGALAAAYWGNREGRADVLAFDMGGTTAKASLSRDGTFPIATESEVARVYRFKRGSGLPLLVPVMDMIEIGAGGGSIAHLNDLGLPAVGPESAGSVPGPACYGSGGRQATVTDADLIIGFLNPDFFLGGEMILEPGMARRAVSALSEGLGMDPDRMAWGIHRLVNENMANAARIHAAERGVDLRGHTMVATGGAGPVHACGVAERLGISTIVIPPAAGVGSAFGLMLAPISFDTSRTYVSRLDDLDFARLADLYGEMEQSGRAVVRDAGVKARDLCTKRAADLRYVGQGHEIRIEIPKEVLEEAGGGAIRARFEAAYRHVYGRTCEGVPIEAVHWRVRVSGPKPVVGQVHAQSTGGRTEILKGSRQALFDADAGPIEVPVYDRYGLIGGFEADGPAIVEEAESTTVVPPGWRVAVDGSGSLVLVHRGDAG